MAAARRKSLSRSRGQADVGTRPSQTRDYICAMTLELARLALEDGDAQLSKLLEAAANAAELPPT